MRPLHSSIVTAFRGQSEDDNCLDMTKQSPCSSNYTICFCCYVWFIPILDLYRIHRALHGNTPKKSCKSDPPPLVPPSDSPPPPIRRKKSTNLDYTDDIAVGNPSVSSRRALLGESSQSASGPKKQSGNSTTPPTPAPPPVVLAPSSNLVQTVQQTAAHPTLLTLLSHTTPQAVLSAQT